VGKKNYFGFTSAHEKVIKTIVATASGAISKAYSAHVKGTDASAFATWFGTGARAQVQGVLHKMNYGMTNGVININYNTAACTPGTNAVAYAPAYGWARANVAQARAAGSAFNLDVCPCLIRQMSSLGSGNQSQVGTLIHEISHLLGNTDDEVNPATGLVAYGASAAKALATTYPTQAVNNAENYGFYVSAYT
jgi:Lysine-specific metallo-endopeptidase